MRVFKFTNFVMVSLFSLAVLAGCKKSTEELSAEPPPAVPVPPTPTPTTTVNPDALKDSSLAYTRDIYLWNTQIPASFNPRNFADQEAIMEAIRPFSIESGFSQPVDRWSFAMKKTEWDQQSAGMSNLFSDATTSAGDFGLSVFFRAEGDLRVRLVEPNSPAGRAGIRRSWRITAINGSTNITTGNAGSIVDNVYYASQTSFKFVKPDGSEENMTLNAAHYTDRPVYMDTVYNVGAQKVGYLVYNSFLGNQSQVSAEFQRVFSGFATKQVSDVVIDLRYNGGGFVSLAEQLANYLAPMSANGALMMKQVYNAENSQNNTSTFFNKRGSLNLPDVYFIVSKSSASASELLINTLKPYMDVKIIGPTATHGKPVGFFPIPVGDWYIFPVSFRTTNKNGEGNYFNGIAVNAQVADGLDKDWGDVTESCLASALRNISGAGYMVQEESYRPQTSQTIAGNNKLDAPFLKVTIGKQP